MPRRIIGFCQDREQHWVAVLECGHRQHVRHTPPWQVRPWVLTAEGRAGYLGTTLPCLLCQEERLGGPQAFNVRHAKPSDARDWAALRHALWPAESSEELATEVEAFFTGRDTLLRAVLVAATEADQLIGFAELSFRPYAEDCTTSPVAFLEGWYVIPSARRQGVGRALVMAAEEWAREQGCREFASDTTLDNIGSTAAHRALGFEDAGVIRCFRKAL